MTRRILVAAGFMAALTTMPSAALANEPTDLLPALAATNAPVPMADPLPFSPPTARAVRELDIMLMVSSLRCRHGVNDFQAEYRAFSARHMPYLNAASRTLHADLVSQHGPRGAKRALDRVSVQMANTFGQGHPTMDCARLKATTADLASREPGHGLHRTAIALLYRPQGGALAIAVQ